MTEDRGSDGYRGDLNRQCVTIAEVLKTAGYRTYMTGKWHVTKGTSQNSSQANWPLQRGFDKYYGTLVGAGNFFNPVALCRQNTIITYKTDPEYQPELYYYTNALSDNAVTFLQQHQSESQDKPFFLYVAYTAAHWPMQALPEDIQKYHGKFDDGYGPHRTARLKRMKELGLVKPETTLSPAAEDWSKVPDKAWESCCMEVYCAMIDSMDAGIGRITRQLEQSGQLENTLILFLQDNGACAETVGRIAGNVPKAESIEGKPLRAGPGVMPGPGDTYVAYGRGWANVSNTPFREYKHWVHEGGISTPLVAHWPRGIPAARSGTLESQPAHLIDVMATCVDLASAKYPTEFAGVSIKPKEGVSLRPAFAGESLNRTQPIYWEHEGNKAIRDGRWKLVAKDNEPWELYNIEVDRIESRNLAAVHPEIAKKLEDQWNAYAERANVLPLHGNTKSQKSTPGDATKTRFEFSAGDKLERNEAPAIANRGFAISAKVTLDNAQANGVVISQGGSRLGFALYFEKGKPRFAVRTAEGLKEVQSERALVGKHELRAWISPKGTLRLEIDGESSTPDVAGSLISNHPGEGLLIGRDEGGTVASYNAPNPFQGTIDSVILEIEPK